MATLSTEAPLRPVFGGAMIIGGTIIGAGILGGVVYWMIAGRNAGAWRTSPPAPPPMPPLPR